MTDDDGSRPDGEPYFAERPRSRPRPAELRFLYRGELLSFRVDRGVFAAHRLDPGTDLLIQNLGVGPRDRVLDLGCGWGAVGVAAAASASEGRVILTEVNRRAAHLAEENLARNHLTNAEVRVGPFFEPVVADQFDTIATNPPYRVGRRHVLRILSEAPAHLAPGGRLLLVGKGSTGIRYYQAWLSDHFPGTVTVLDRASGYRVLEARRAAASRHR
ncbi:MAG TPA: methyltransferase [Thermoplasmata archaeon]|nr:methyltransferase [Thermoplasmata archaeon]